jgi:hypothetical protein
VAVCDPQRTGAECEPHRLTADVDRDDLVPSALQLGHGPVVAVGHPHGATAGGERTRAAPDEVLARDAAAVRVDQFLKRFNAAGREAVRELRALDPPPAQRARAAAMVAAITEMVQSLDGRIADLQAGKGNASDRIKAYLDGYSDLTPAAAVLGLSECQGVSL